MYNLEKDHIFIYENVCEEFWNLQEYDCFSVYYDSALTQPVDITIERDYDAKGAAYGKSSVPIVILHIQLLQMVR